MVVGFVRAPEGLVGRLRGLSQLNHDDDDDELVGGGGVEGPAELMVESVPDDVGRWCAAVATSRKALGNMVACVFAGTRRNEPGLGEMSAMEDMVLLRACANAAFECWGVDGMPDDECGR